MDPGAAAGRLIRSEGGLATVQYTAAAGMALVVFVLMANLLVVQYGRGVVRAALDEGSRAGAAAGTEVCLARAAEVLGQLLAGPAGSGITVRCADDGSVVRATAEGTLPGWLPGIPDFEVSMEALAAREPE
ncbi:MAG: hypothetical protein R6X29_08625 [Acidimicrobiia bacterium]